MSRLISDCRAFFRRLRNLRRSSHCETVAVGRILNHQLNERTEIFIVKITAKPDGNDGTIPERYEWVLVSLLNGASSTCLGMTSTINEFVSFSR